MNHSGSFPPLASAEMLEAQRRRDLEYFQSSLPKVERAIEVRRKLSEASAFRESWNARQRRLENEARAVARQRNGDPDD